MDNIIYIIINESMPGYVKIGRTSNLKRRLKELYTTPVPLPFECHYACEVENGKETEEWLFRIFKAWRISKDREFFRIEPEGAVEALKIKALREVTPEQIYVESEGDRKALEKAKEKRDRFNFEMVGIPLSAEIYFSRDENKKAKVVDLRSARSIEFDRKITSLSLSAQKILGYKYGVAGTDYWMYDGETLDRRRRRFEEGNDDEIMQTTNKKECPKCKSIKIRDAGVRMGAAVAVLPGREIPEPRQPIYECEDCGENFFIE